MDRKVNGALAVMLTALAVYGSVVVLTSDQATTAMGAITAAAIAGLVALAGRSHGRPS